MSNIKQIQYYNELYKKQKSQAMRPKKEYGIFLKHFGKLKKGAKILDVACGTGYLLKLATDKDLQTFGIDISEQAVKIAKQNSPESEIKIASAESLPYADIFFDYITCLGSIEHFENINKGISEMLRVAKNNAKFLFLVPNKKYFAWYFTKQKGTHQRDIGEQLYDLNEWKEILMQNKLKIIKIKQDKYPTKSLSWFYSSNIIKIIKRIMFKLIWLILPLKLTYQFIIIAEKGGK